MVDEIKRGMSATLDSLPQSNMCLANTPTSPDDEKACACGAMLRPYHVDRAEFNGKVYQEDSWIFPERCSECTKNLSMPRKNIIEFDPMRQEAVLVEKLNRIFAGERPAREYTIERFQADIQNQEAYNLASSFIGQFDAYLWGPCGVGKTHLACAMVREAVAQGRTAIALKPSKLSRFLRVKEATVQEERMRELATADVLLIDELGIGKETEFALQIMQEVLDMRADNYRTGLIMTSNYSLEDLANKIGEDAIPSRLRQMCRIVKIEGQDRRVTIKKAT